MGGEQSKTEISRKPVVYAISDGESKFYIGETNDIDRRIWQHRHGLGTFFCHLISKFFETGAEFTKDFASVKGFFFLLFFFLLFILPRKQNNLLVLETTYNINGTEELSMTLRYMKRYGIQNVRGSKYCQLKFSNLQLYDIKTSLWSFDPFVCVRCGKRNHRVVDCHEQHDVDGMVIPELGETANTDHPECGKKWEPNEPVCFENKSKTNINDTLDFFPKQQSSVPFAAQTSQNQQPQSKPKPNVNPVLNKKKRKWESATCCYRCGREGHWIDECFAATTVNKVPLETECTRCGRDSHTVKECYAKIHVSGKRLRN